MTGQGGAWKKWEWACYHLEALEAELNRISNDPERQVKFKSEFDAETWTYLFRVARTPDMQEAQLRVGDIVHNFRGALDHLVWGLAMHGPGPRPPDPSLIQFPMASNAKSFKSQVDSRLPCLSVEQRAIVKRYQPYRHTSTGRAMKVLRDLSNRDKHRLLVTAVVGAWDCKLKFHGIGCGIVSSEVFWSGMNAVKADAKIARISVVPDGSPKFSVKMEATGHWYVALAYGRPLMNALIDIRSVVQSILRELS